MIPVASILTMNLEQTTYPTETYKIVLDKDRINGLTDEVEALCQAIYLILNTERYQHIIYSWDYGVELFDLIGQQMSYVIAEVDRRITEALIQDDRILNVTNFQFEHTKRSLHVTFDVISIYGVIKTEKEVAI